MTFKRFAAVALVSCLVFMGLHVTAVMPDQEPRWPAPVVAATDLDDSEDIPLLQDVLKQSRKFIPKADPIDDLEGLKKVATPKFIFGASMLVFIVVSVLKLAFIVAVAFVIVEYIRNRRGKNTEGVKKDPIDAFIASVGTLLDKLEKEAQDHQAEAAKLGDKIARLKNGVSAKVSEPPTREVSNE